MSIDIQMIRDAIYRLKKDKVIKLQKDIARDTGYEEATVSEILNEKQVLSEKFVRAFVKAYGLNWENLESISGKEKEIEKRSNMESVDDGYRLMYTELLKQMDKTNELALRLTDTLNARDIEAKINIDTINKNALIILRLSEVLKEVAGETKLKKVMGKVS